MTDQEVNRVIAEFMGAKFYDTHDPEPVLHLDGIEINIEGFDYYTKSLDALVEVWEKLKCVPDFEWDWNENQHKDMYWCEITEKYSMPKPYGYSCGNTIQQAAAHATAKAIKELNND